MVNWLRRNTVDQEERARLGIPKQERIVAWATRSNAMVVATNVALYGVGERLPWHRITKAQWVEPVLEIVTADAPPQHLRVLLTDARDLPYAVHTCVTDSVIVSERLDLGDGKGAIAAARKTEHDDVIWTVVFDSGIDPTDPEIRADADEALANLRSTLGI